MNAHPRLPAADDRPAAPTADHVVTESGRRLDLTAPRTDAIQLSDIAGALARLPVWGGMAGAGPWSLAAQALYAEAFNQAQGGTRGSRAVVLLLHARQAYLGGPAAAFLAGLAAVADRQFEPAKGHVIRESCKTLEVGLDRAIREALGLPVLTAAQREAADHYHRVAELAAWTDLMSGPPPAHLAGVAIRGRLGRVTVQPWPDVAARFLDRARTLLGAAS